MIDSRGWICAMFAWVVGLVFATTAVAIAEDHDDELVWNTRPDVRVDVEIVSGEIEIEAWDREEVKVEVENGRASGLDIDAGRRRVSIRSPGLRRRNLRLLGQGDEVDVRIFVPVMSRIEAKTVNGTIRAEGVEGSLDLHAANGQIEVGGRPREAKLETINSSIKLEGEAERVDARTINGSIELKGVAQELSASTISGSIKVEGGVLERADLKTLSGSIELRTRLAPGARARLKSFSGSVKVELPPETSARFDLQSFSGGIQNELAASNTSSRPRRGGQHLEFTAGEGDGRVTIESFSGSVEIEVDD